MKNMNMKEEDKWMVKSLLLLNISDCLTKKNHILKNNSLIPLKTINNNLVDIYT